LGIPPEVPVGLAFLHGRLATAAFFFTLICGLWSMVNYLRGRGVSPSYWGALVIGEVLLIVQGGVGLLLYLGGQRPFGGTFIHVLYGVVAVIPWPAVYLFTQGRDTRRESLFYSLAGLFLAGIIIRGIITGGGTFSL
jgi:uncharacterized protein YybS (DUF2232 family)